MNAEQKRNRLSNVILRLLAFTSLVAWPAFAAPITVTNTNDSGPGSLRDALANASSGDIINFNLAYPATITLSTTLSINSSLTMSGPGAANLAISGNSAVQVLQIASGITVAISGVTIENGSMYDPFGFSDGGGIRNYRTLLLSNSTISENLAYGTGGGISSTGPVSLTNTTVLGNTTGIGGDGGGIYSTAPVSLTNSSISANSARGGQCGGISAPLVSLTNSAVYGNGSYFEGGGICAGTLSLTNSTVSFNGSDHCGGIDGGTVMLIIAASRTTTTPSVRPAASVPGVL